MSKIQDCGKDGCVIDRLTIKLTIKEEKTAKLYGDALVWTTVLIDWLDLNWIDWIDFFWSIEWKNPKKSSVDVYPKSYTLWLNISWDITHSNFIILWL